MKRVVTELGNSVTIGQNAKENDALFTQTSVSDVLFHVKGLPGAHVWFHSKGGQSPHRSEVVMCAQLCKEYSKCNFRVTIDYLTKRYVGKDYQNVGSVIFRKRPESIVI